MIEVTTTSDSDPLAFQVVIRDPDGESHHHVTIKRAVCEGLTAGRHPAERCIEAAFRFLLDREPKEAILAHFDIAVISRYFPEFEQELPRYLSQT